MNIEVSPGFWAQSYQETQPQSFDTYLKYEGSAPFALALVWRHERTAKTCFASWHSPQSSSALRRKWLHVTCAWRELGTASVKTSTSRQHTTHCKFLDRK